MTVRGRHVPEKYRKGSVDREAVRLQAGDPGEREDRQRLGDRHRRHAGPRPRHHPRRAQLRQGTGAERFPLTEDTGLALTTALYYTPSGRSIQKPLDAAKFGLGATTPNPNDGTEFRTDKGRKVTGGGGIQPDIVVFPPRMTRLRAVLDAARRSPTSPPNICGTNKITEDFEVTSQMLGEFQVFLSERGIQPASPNGPASATSSPTG